MNEAFALPCLQQRADDHHGRREPICRRSRAHGTLENYTVLTWVGFDVTLFEVSGDDAETLARPVPPRNSMSRSSSTNPPAAVSPCRIGALDRE